MKKILKARKGGFTLVELLIVIMIIAILAGMMMLSMGSATDSAEAAKIINDLRALKAAAVFLYIDSGQSWSWVVEKSPYTATESVCVSLDRYMDRPMLTTSIYALSIATGKDVSVTADTVVSRDLIGIGTTWTNAVKEKLKGNAKKVGLYGADGKEYNLQDVVYMSLK